MWKNCFRKSVIWKKNIYIYYHWNWPSQGTGTVPIVSAHFRSILISYTAVQLRPWASACVSACRSTWQRLSHCSFDGRRFAWASHGDAGGPLSWRPVSRRRVTMTTVDTGWCYTTDQIHETEISDLRPKLWPPDQCRDEVSDLERSAHKAQLSVGPNSSTQPNPSQSENFGPINQPNPQPNRTPCNQQQTFGHKEDNSGTLFHRNVIAVTTEDAPNCRFTNRTVWYKLQG